jgi:hypothetical protein
MIAALTAFIVMAYTPTWAEPPRPATVGEFLSVCETDPGRCADDLFDVIYENSVGDQLLGFCMPDKDTPEQITAVAVGWLKARPELSAAETDPTLLKAMEANYPC